MNQMERQLIQLEAAQKNDRERLDRLEGMVENVIKERGECTKNHEKMMSQLVLTQQANSQAISENAKDISDIGRAIKWVVALVVSGFVAAVLRLVLK